MLLLRLSGRKRCDLVQRKGSRWNGKHLSIKWLPGPPRHPNVNPSTRALYVGVVTSLALDASAVKRNRMRRRCREALRIALQKYTKTLPTIQLLLVPRSSSMQCAFQEIEADIETFLSTL